MKYLPILVVIFLLIAVVSGERSTQAKSSEGALEARSERSLQSIGQAVPEGVKEMTSEQKQSPEIRTATGGFINSIMIFLTVIAFCGNAMFLCYVFWLSK